MHLFLLQLLHHLRRHHNDILIHTYHKVQLHHLYLEVDLLEEYYHFLLD